MDEWGNYRRTSKKNFIIWQLIIGTIELALFIYFYFVTNRWGNLADDANEQPPKEDENKDNEKNDKNDENKGEDDKPKEEEPPKGDD